MDNAKLIINSQEEFPMTGILITIGRASDNDISLPEDSNISRFHAEIENRDGEFWLIDLGSFNGTSLNGERIESEKPLFDGDLITFGGSSTAKVVLEEPEDEKDEDENEEEKSDSNEKAASDSAPNKSSKMTVMLVIAALAVGLAVIFVFAAGLYYYTRTTSTAGCSPTAKISNLEDFSVISESTEIEIELENGDCVAKAVFMIGDQELGEAESQPFTVTLNPDQFGQLSDGQTHNIKVILQDAEGKTILQSSEVAVIIRTIETKTPTPTPVVTDNTNPDPQTNTERNGNKTVTLIDVNNMSQKILPQFRGKFKYKTNNKFFLEAVQKKTAEFKAEGYFERAKQFRDVIDTQFIQEQNLDPPLGYILAMSRSKFTPSNDSNGAGLWRMSNALAVNGGYTGLCGTDTIAAPSQNCAAIASSSYLKDLILRVFEGDVVYGIAAFGMTSEEAATWEKTLPANRSDFWNVIKSPQQREEIVRFFAAAMVAENPQKFGLKNDRPLSELYKDYMK